ncbi:penicillin acylase family protein [Sanguibacter suaedae]|uniref:Penicillin acylase family protein n=1 Tax=Sanguibacter suaedae TaxID=2795737 RepID=A0A934IF89_9MICO|nr:penicillin acylase family protein [Sanguibacter suaedae]MBI9115869.1 penicillin acylase family protein [Sanguibacter suaedae]
MSAELFRDAWGVPHLRASDHLELAEAQGRVTALDRGWQIEVDRWRAEGRLAERIGAGGLAWDRFARRSRLPDTARAVYEGLAAGDRAWVDAYVRGVNAGLAGSPRPAEVRALDARFGDTTPHEPWPAWAPVGVLLVAHALFSTFPHLLWAEHVARTLGPGAVGLFMGGERVPASGSNAWGLHGSRTASGLPLLAGDPHRVLELPGVYQQVHLACPDFDVVGLAFPGVPGIAHFGHTGGVAWGVTNALAHQADVHREDLRRDGEHVEARGPDGWEPVHRSEETALVRGGEPVTIEVLETVRGPVVVGGATDPAGSTRSADARGTLGSSAFSLRTPVRVDADAGIGALLPLLRARTTDDVVAALDGWVDPVNRVVAADTRGRVVSVVAGRCPERAPAQRVRPLDAWSPDARPAPWRTMPPAWEVVDLVVDANERPADPDRDLGCTYAPPHRARRVRELLAEQQHATAADMGAVHGDTHLAGTNVLLGRLAALDDLCVPAKDLRELLLGWDGRMDAGSSAAGAYAALRTALVTRVAAHPALAPLHRPHGAGDVLAPWFSVVARVGDALPELLASRRGDVAPDGSTDDSGHSGDLPLLDVATELRAALDDVAHRETGTWGDAHTVLPVHVLADVDGCTPPPVPAVPLGGDTDCVCATTSTPGLTDRSWRGPVARWVWDLADRSASRWAVPFGTHGDPDHPHFADQHPLWARAGTLPVVDDWDQLAREDLP